MSLISVHGVSRVFLKQILPVFSLNLITILKELTRPFSSMCPLLLPAAALYPSYTKRQIAHKDRCTTAGPVAWLEDQSIKRTGVHRTNGMFFTMEMKDLRNSNRPPSVNISHVTNGKVSEFVVVVIVLKIESPCNIDNFLDNYLIIPYVRIILVNCEKCLLI